MLLKALRTGLGQLVIFIDFITRPKPLQRPAEEQQQVDQACADLALYQFRGCPFCVRTRREIRRLSLPIEYRDAAKDQHHRATLEREGGKIQVPCLRIQEGEKVRWLYESDAIKAYLGQRFDPDYTPSDDTVKSAG